MAICPCTLLQNALDDLMVQFHKTLDYLNSRHDFLPTADNQVKASDPNVHPDSAEEFAKMLEDFFFSFFVLEKIIFKEFLKKELSDVKIVVYY
ncbi:hypothetical protein PCK1_000716 [Pneumocystis canis]|nr:hypothetical protein PCK1_000716 [Pneumocystis canis]